MVGRKGRGGVASSLSSCSSRRGGEGLARENRIVRRRCPESGGISRRRAARSDQQGLEAYEEAYGVSLTKEEERERIRQVVELLNSGSSLEDAVREGVGSGRVDRKTLAVLHRRVHGERRGEAEEGGAAMQRALSILYDKLATEYQKRNLSPTMKLLGECLDVLLDADADEEAGEGGDGDGETRGLLRVKGLLDESFLQADLGLDPISAASVFARAESDEKLQAEIDSYLDGKLQKDTFVTEVEERLEALRAEFREMEREEQEAARGSEWIEGVERRNHSRTQKMQRDRIIKYVTYILDLAQSC